MFNLTPAVRNLLLANLAFYLLQVNVRLNPSITQLGSLYPVGSPYFHVWQFVTYMFLHDPLSWSHLIFNMFGLISFGPLLEQRWGGRRFIAFWLICGIGAGVLYEGTRAYDTYRMEQAAVEFHRLPSGADFNSFFSKFFPEAEGYQQLAAALERNPNNQEYLEAATKSVDAAVEASLDSPNGGMLGASGALFGVLFAFAYLFPNTELFLLFFPFPIKAKYFVLGYAALELFQGVHRSPGDHVAHFAHLGGLLIGFIVVRLWETGRTRFY